jgi:hypothetical protein
MPKEPEVEGTVSIIPIKQQHGKRRHAETSTDKQLDAYKLWLRRMKEEDPKISILKYLHKSLNWLRSDIMLL